MPPPPPPRLVNIIGTIDMNSYVKRARGLYTVNPWGVGGGMGSVRRWVVFETVK